MSTLHAVELLLVLVASRSIQGWILDTILLSGL
jgi:hypothetical protein